MRCKYCHNKEFVLPEFLEKNKGNIIPETAIFNFLEKRKWFLDWVSICWWEPTLHKDLPDFCKKVKAMGYEVKLDTNGTNPDMIEKLISEKLVDYIAMDIKHDFSKYHEIVWVEIKVDIYERSKKIIMESWIDYEFRSTISRWVHTLDVLKKMVLSIDWAKRYFLQNYRGATPLDPCFTGESFTRGEIELLKENLKDIMPTIQVRY